MKKMAAMTLGPSVDVINTQLCHSWSFFQNCHISGIIGKLKFHGGHFGSGGRVFESGHRDSNVAPKTLYHPPKFGGSNS